MRWRSRLMNLHYPMTHRILPHARKPCARVFHGSVGGERVTLAVDIPHGGNDLHTASVPTSLSSLVPRVARRFAAYAVYPKLHGSSTRRITAHFPTTCSRLFPVCPFAECSPYTSRPFITRLVTHGSSHYVSRHCSVILAHGGS